MSQNLLPQRKPLCRLFRRSQLMSVEGQGRISGTNSSETQIHVGCFFSDTGSGRSGRFGNQRRLTILRRRVIDRRCFQCFIPWQLKRYFRTLIFRWRRQRDIKQLSLPIAADRKNSVRRHTEINHRSCVSLLQLLYAFLSRIESHNRAVHCTKVDGMAVRDRTHAGDGTDLILHVGDEDQIIVHGFALIIQATHCGCSGQSATKNASVCESGNNFSSIRDEIHADRLRVSEEIGFQCLDEFAGGCAKHVDFFGRRHDRSQLRFFVNRDAQNLKP